MADDRRAELTRRLEEHFRRITLLLYDTSVPIERVHAEVDPHLDDQVTFIDPWQTGVGLDRYRLGVAGFHAMFKFELEIHQLNVWLDEQLRTGRVMVDGVMHLRQFAPLLTYPLRTMLVYDFVVTDPGDPAEGRDVKFLIRVHEEMWSIGDMLAAVPVLGWGYKNVFRRLFAVGFLAASRVSSRWKGSLSS